MKLQPKAVQKVSNLLLWVLIALEVFLTIIYLAGIVLTGKAYPAFDMDGQMTVPSLLQALQLFLIGFISLSLLIRQRHSSQRPSRFFLLTIGLLFIYGGVDEIFKIHLQLHALLRTPHNRDWMIGYLAIGLTTLVVFYKDFWAIWHFHRKSTFLVALGMSIFFLGGFGSEVLKVLVLQPLLSQIYQQGDLIPVVVEKSRVAVEEFSEMLGESITLYGLFLYVAKRLLEKEPLSSTIKQ